MRPLFFIQWFWPFNKIGLVIQFVDQIKQPVNELCPVLVVTGGKIAGKNYIAILTIRWTPLLDNKTLVYSNCCT